MTRLPALDILRALAVICVLGRHIPMPPAEMSGWHINLLVWWQNWGWIGVDLFFVLSGFLVSGLLFKEYQRTGTIRPWRFLVRRGFKIYPGFYLLLILTVIIELFILGHFPNDGWKRALIEAIYIQNYLPGFWDHTWSLAIEEHFYIALVILFMGRLRRAKPFGDLPQFIATACVLTLLARIVTVFSVWPFAHHVHHFPTHLRFDSLLYGVLLAYGYSFHHERLSQFVQRNSINLFLISLLLISPMLLLTAELSRFVESIGFTLLALAFTAWTALIVCCDGPIHRRLVAHLSFLIPVGVASYSIYLWHMPVRRWVIPFIRHELGIPLSYPLALLIYFLGGIAVGLLLAKFIEFPFLRLRDRLFPSTLARETAPQSSC